MEPPYLRTERLVMRPFTLDDAQHLIDLDSDPEVMRFITDGAPTSPDVVHNQLLPKIMRDQAANPNLGVWAALDRGSEEFLGWFHLRPFNDDPQVLELGYRLTRGVWGQGLATEGSRALIAKGFHELGANRIVARTMRANIGSQRVMKKAGLTFDSNFVEDRFPGADKAAVLYALTREEYEVMMASSKPAGPSSPPPPRFQY